MSSPPGSEAAAQRAAAQQDMLHRVDEDTPTRETVGGDDANPEGGDAAATPEVDDAHQQGDDVDKTIGAEEEDGGNDADRQSGDVAPQLAADDTANPADAVDKTIGAEEEDGGNDADRQSGDVAPQLAADDTANPADAVDKTIGAEEEDGGNDADRQSGDVAPQLAADDTANPADAEAESDEVEDVPQHEVKGEQAAVAEAVPDADALELGKAAASDSKTLAHTSGDEEPKKGKRGRPPKQAPDSSQKPKKPSKGKKEGAKPEKKAVEAVSDKSAQSSKGDAKPAELKEPEADSGRGRKRGRARSEAGADEEAGGGARARGKYSWPPDPDEARLTPEGAVCDAQSRLKLSAYSDLKTLFPDEAAPARHPDPENPGIREEELAGAEAAISLEFLINWSDDKGAGWRTLRQAIQGKNKAESRWFGARSWGSWRMAFLMARLQRDVWQRAAAASAAPDAAAAAAEEPAAEEAAPPADPLQKVLHGPEPWKIFSPKVIDLRLCMARTWNDGKGGQCSEPREDGCDLCYKCMRRAASVAGLIYGMVDGPIPPGRLEQFERAAVTGATGAKAAAKDGDEPSRPRNVKTRLRAKTAPAAGPKEPKQPEAKAAKRKRRSGRPDKAQPEEPPAGVLQEEPPRQRNRAKRKQPEEQPPDTEPPPPPGYRSRRLQSQQPSKEEAREHVRQRWSSVGHAMDEALEQIEAEAKLGPVGSYQHSDGFIPLSNIGHAIAGMSKTSKTSHRLRFAMILRESVLQQKEAGVAFVQGGGVSEIRSWLQSALNRDTPPEALRQHEAVALECLALLEELPMTLDCLKATGIGRTLTGLRSYCEPAMVDAGALVAKWTQQFQKELEIASRKEAAVKTEAAQAPQTAVKVERARKVQSKQEPIQGQRVFKDLGAARSSSSAAAAAERPSLVPGQGSNRSGPSIKSSARAKMMQMRSRQKKPSNKTEDVLRELFLLGKVLDESKKPAGSTVIDIE
ncbi:unnamed protein product [Symbiodinium sp. CCMP2592]|nr:unnamed protein product [Symbiodinium sp. CCMP2592]